MRSRAWTAVLTVGILAPLSGCHVPAAPAPSGMSGVSANGLAADGLVISGHAASGPTGPTTGIGVARPDQPEDRQAMASATPGSSPAVPSPATTEFVAPPRTEAHPSPESAYHPSVVRLFDTNPAPSVVIPPPVPPVALKSEAPTPTPTLVPVAGLSEDNGKGAHLGGQRTPVAVASPATQPLPPAPPPRVFKESASSQDRPEPNPDTDPPVVAALRAFLSRHPEEAVTRLQAYDQPTQEALLALLPVVARVSEGGLRNPRDVAALLETFETLHARVGPKADLGLDHLCFCRRISGFGVYEPLHDPVFRPGDLMRLYVEPKRFASERQDLSYVTRLKSGVEIRDYNGKVVSPAGFGGRDRADVSQTCRHDYFINYQLYVPEIPPGSYVLWLEVTDMATNRTARVSRDFRVVAGPAQDR